ncbi:MAG: STAS domain-containing protein [Actinomycetes bacterium]
MSEPQVTMSVHVPERGTAVIEISGEVTAACEPVLMSAYEEACAPGTRFIVLDFTGLSYMNSGGIGMLVTLLVRANRQQQKLAAVGLTDHYRQIFELTRLDEAIALHADAQTALMSA